MKKTKSVSIPVHMTASDMAALKKVPKAKHPKRIDLGPGKVTAAMTPEEMAAPQATREAETARSREEFPAVCAKCGAPARADGTCSLAGVPCAVASDHPDFGKKSACQQLAEMYAAR